jgi:hypothetical protein
MAHKMRDTAAVEADIPQLGISQSLERIARRLPLAAGDHPRNTDIHDMLEPAQPSAGGRSHPPGQIRPHRAAHSGDQDVGRQRSGDDDGCDRRQKEFAHDNSIGIEGTAVPLAIGL